MSSFLRLADFCANYFKISTLLITSSFFGMDQVGKAGGDKWKSLSEAVSYLFEIK